MVDCTVHGIELNVATKGYVYFIIAGCIWIVLLAQVLAVYREGVEEVGRKIFDMLAEYVTTGTIKTSGSK